jgi:hypothetical protein
LTTEYFVQESLVASAALERNAAPQGMIWQTETLMTDPLAISENENAKGTQAELKNCTILHNDDDFSRVRVGRWAPKKNAKGTQAGSNSSRIKKMQASDACCSNLFSEQPTTLRFPAAGMRPIGDTQSLRIDSPLRKIDGCSHLNIVAEHGDSALGRAPTYGIQRAPAGQGITPVPASR